MAEVLSKSDYAARRGVNRSAVNNWITRGRLKAPAVRDDGSIDADLADQQLNGTTAPMHVAGSRNRVTRQQAPVVVASGDATWSGPREQAGTQLLRARALSAMVAAERARRELMAERGRFVLKAETEATFAKAIADFLLQVEQSLPDLAMALGLDAAGRVALRRWWRNQRVAGAEGPADGSSGAGV
jgi:hypothetical protein